MLAGGGVLARERHRRTEIDGIALHLRLCLARREHAQAERCDAGNAGPCLHHDDPPTRTAAAFLNRGEGWRPCPSLTPTGVIELEQAPDALRTRRLHDDPAAAPPEKITAARDIQLALLDKRPEGIDDRPRVRVVLVQSGRARRQPFGERPCPRSPCPGICAAPAACESLPCGGRSRRSHSWFPGPLSRSFSQSVNLRL